MPRLWVVRVRGIMACDECRAYGGTCPCCEDDEVSDRWDYEDPDFERDSRRNGDYD